MWWLGYLAISRLKLIIIMELDKQKEQVIAHESDVQWMFRSSSYRINWQKIVYYHKFFWVWILPKRSQQSECDFIVIDVIQNKPTDVLNMNHMKCNLLSLQNPCCQHTTVPYSDRERAEEALYCVQCHSCVHCRRATKFAVPDGITYEMCEDGGENIGSSLWKGSLKKVIKQECMKEMAT